MWIKIKFFVMRIDYDHFADMVPVLKTISKDRESQYGIGL